MLGFRTWRGVPNERDAPLVPEAFKWEAVDRMATSRLSVGKVAAELGLHKTVLRQWMMLYEAQATGRQGAPTRKRRPRRRLIWPPRTPGSDERTSGFGWSATS
jgi:transposase-like protein